MMSLPAMIARFLRLAPATVVMEEAEEWTAEDAARLRLFLDGVTGGKLQRLLLASMYRRALDGRRYDDFEQGKLKGEASLFGAILAYSDASEDNGQAAQSAGSGSAPHTPGQWRGSEAP